MFKEKLFVFKHFFINLLCAVLYSCCTENQTELPVKFTTPCPNPSLSAYVNSSSILPQIDQGQIERLEQLSFKRSSGVQVWKGIVFSNCTF